MKYSNTLPKFQTKELTNEQIYFMELSLAECEDKEFKEVHCPHCDRLIGYCPVNEDNYNLYFCHYCKANMYLNGRYFKTSRNHMNRRIYLKRKYNLY